MVGEGGEKLREAGSNGRALGVVVAIGLLAGSLALGAPGATAAPATSAHLKHQSGPYAVGVRSYTFVDKTRPTARNNTYPGAPTRTLPTALYYPAKGDPTAAAVENARPVRRGRGFPLIVFSHGFGATGPAYRIVLERFVREGYVVAAPTFPLSSGGAPGGARLGDYVNQPADVSFVVTRVLRLARRSANGLRRTIDGRHIGAAGHSLGAITTLGVAGNSCCLDRRIDAAVAWSGVQLPYPGTFFSVPTPPLMLVHGTSDRTVPFAGSVAAYNAAPAPKALVTLVGGPHTFFLAPWYDPAVHSTTDFFDGFLKHERGAFRRLASDANVPGVASLQAAPR